jgi:hypothetical protein
VSKLVRNFIWTKSSFKTWAGLLVLLNYGPKGLIWSPWCRTVVPSEEREKFGGEGQGDQIGRIFAISVTLGIDRNSLNCWYFFARKKWCIDSDRKCVWPFFSQTHLVTLFGGPAAADFVDGRLHRLPILVSLTRLGEILPLGQYFLVLGAFLSEKYRPKFT